MFCCTDTIVVAVVIPQDSKKHYLDPDLEIELSVVLSNAHIELNRNPLASKRIMTDLEKELKSSDHYTKPHNHAKINLGWAKVHRLVMKV